LEIHQVLEIHQDFHQFFTKFWKLFSRSFHQVFKCFNLGDQEVSGLHQGFTAVMVGSFERSVSSAPFPGNPMAMKRWWIPGRPSVSLNSPGRVFPFFGVKLMCFTLKFGLNLVKFQNLVKTW
jgi:hypothetical protein